MLIIFYGKMFAPILRKFGLSSGHFRGLLPPENSQNGLFLPILVCFSCFGLPILPFFCEKLWNCNKFYGKMFAPILHQFGHSSGHFRGLLPPENSQNWLFLPISWVLGFQILYFLVRSFEMLIVVYGEMFAPILRLFGLSSGHFRGLLPPENSQNCLFLPISWVLGFQIFQFLVRSFEMLIVVYGKIFAPIWRLFGLSSGLFRGCYPLNIAKMAYLCLFLEFWASRYSDFM